MTRTPDWLAPSIAAVALIFSLPAGAGVVIASIGTNAAGVSSLVMNVNLSGSGVASTGSGLFSATGSVSESGAFGGNIGVTLSAMKNVDAASATLGDQLTAGTFNWSSNILGVDGNPNGGGIGYEAGNREGISISLNASTDISPSVGVQITAINVQNVGRDGTDPSGESFTVVNLLTRQSLEIVPTSGSAGNFDVTSLNLTMASGASGPLAAIYSGDVGGFRVAGISLETVPGPPYPPTAASGSIATTQGTAVDIDLLTLASDVESTGPQLRFTVSNSVNGSVILLADGHTARFTPAAGYTGTANFDYTVTDATSDPRIFLNYRFQGASAADSSGNGRDGTLIIQGTGGVAFNAEVPAALSPQYSQSLVLTENNMAGAARIERSITSAELDFLSSDWSVAGWFKRNSTTDIDTVFQLGNSGGWGDNAMSLVLPAGSTSIELRNYAGAVGDVYVIKTGVVTGQWHHFAIVRSGSSLGFYLNGSLVENDNAFNFTFDPTKPIKLGGVNGGSFASHWERWLDGGLADFAVFSAALSPAEVTRLAGGPTANFGGQSAGNSITVSVSLPTLYDTWISTGFPELLNADKLASADPDQDGCSNLLEFVFGGIPNIQDSGIRPTSTIIGANLVFVFRRADIATYLNPVAEYSADLKVWTTAQNGVNGVAINVVDDGISYGIDQVTVTVPRVLGADGRLFIRLRAQQNEPNGTAPSLVTVFADQPGPFIDPRFFGVGIMYWNEDDNALANGQIASKLNAMNCRLLRFPGGTESDNYLWNTHLLADKRRWPWVDGPATTDTDEFIAFCRQVDADPLICVNTEIAAFDSLEAGAKLAADWVYYCNVIKQYGVVYWEIGNEPYYHTRFTPAEYGQLFLTYARAMKAVDPNIKVVAVGDWKVATRGMKERIPESLREEAMQAEYANEMARCRRCR